MYLTEYPDYKIDSEFFHLNIPDWDVSYSTLRKSILQNGCQKAITIWNNYIIDGYNRFDICKKYGIPILLKQLNVSSREEVISWICKKQLNHAKLTFERKKYLIGKQYIAEKNLNQNGKEKNIADFDKYQNNSGYHTAMILGNKYNVSISTIYTYRTFANMMDVLFEKNAALAEKVLSGILVISHADMRNLIPLSEQELNTLNQYLSENKRSSCHYQEILQHLFPNNHGTINSKLHKAAYKVTPKIKQIPPYDPDSEVSSLTLTIPYWISSMERTKKNSSLKNISSVAKNNLTTQLYALEKTIKYLLTAMEEN